MRASSISIHGDLFRAGSEECSAWETISHISTINNRNCQTATCLPSTHMPTPCYCSYRGMQHSTNTIWLQECTVTLGTIGVFLIRHHDRNWSIIHIRESKLYTVPNDWISLQGEVSMYYLYSNYMQCVSTPRARLLNH